MLEPHSLLKSFAKFEKYNIHSLNKSVTMKKVIDYCIYQNVEVQEGWLTVRSRNKWGFADIDGNPLIVDGLEG